MLLMTKWSQLCKNKRQSNPYSVDSLAASPESCGFQSKSDNLNLKACPSCGRKFLPKPYEVHTRIWEKVFWHKRKVFNSSKQRMICREQLVLMKKNMAKEELRRKQEFNK